MQSKEIIALLENEDAKSFITSKMHCDLAELALQCSSETRFNIAVCLQIMGIYKKAQQKLPYFTTNYLALDKRCYEQATSERIAKYKQRFIFGNTLVDLTAGLGVDSMILSEVFAKVVAVEHNEELHNLAVYNVQKAGLFNLKRLLGNGASYLHEKVDWVYIDPDRRPTEKKTITIEKLEPNVLLILPQLEQYCDNAYIKLSPLFDVDEVWRVFKNAISIIILAEQNEIKEVGVILSFNKKIKIQEIKLADVVLGFEFSVKLNEKVKNIETVSSERNYLLVPNALLTKSRLAIYYMAEFKVVSHDSFGYYFAKEKYLNQGFRTFKILSISGFSPSEIRNKLGLHQIKKVNIIIKGLSDKPAIWHKKLKTKDGGNFYLFMLKGKTKQAVLCEFISY